MDDQDQLSLAHKSDLLYDCGECIHCHFRWSPRIIGCLLLFIWFNLFLIDVCRRLNAGTERSAVRCIYGITKRIIMNCLGDMPQLSEIMENVTKRLISSTQKGKAITWTKWNLMRHGAVYPSQIKFLYQKSSKQKSWYDVVVRSFHFLLPALLTCNARLHFSEIEKKTDHSRGMKRENVQFQLVVHAMLSLYPIVELTLINSSFW